MSSERATPHSGLMKAVAEAARAWRDPGCDERAEAVQQTLRAPNRFTEEALAFAVNAAMHRLTPAALRAWLGACGPAEAQPAEAQPAEGLAVGVVPGEAPPLAGLQAVLAVLLTGHRCVLRPPDASPVLVPAFVEAVRQQGADDLSFACAGVDDEVFADAQAVIGAGSEEAAFHRQCEDIGIPPARRHWRQASFSVAVLDGHEEESEREGLAEDTLLYEGHGSASVRLLWAPAGTAPDPYLEALAHFRAVFPAHPDTPGALKMQQAFLRARDRPHAHGEGLEFLMSRGAPEVQVPGHLRWAEYETLDEVGDWLETRADQVRAVVARPALTEEGRPPPGWAALEPGTVHRQLLEAPEAHRVLEFVAAL